MNPNEEYACVSYSWLLEEIEKRNRIAFKNSFEKYAAALIIQKFYRQYKKEKTFKTQTKATITLQKYVRGYLTRKKHIRYLEFTYVKLAYDYYNTSATKIQCVWRGYWSRKTIHDHKKMNRIQREAAEELILCIAHKLHYLLRTNNRPGIYSIRSSNCLSRIEKLLSRMKFRRYNDVCRKLKYNRDNKLQKLKQEDIRKLPRIPFGTRCVKAYDDLKFEEMTEILEQYENSLKAAIDRVKKSPTEPDPMQVAREHIRRSLRHCGILEDEASLSLRSEAIYKVDSVDIFIDKMEDIAFNEESCDRTECSLDENISPLK